MTDAVDDKAVGAGLVSQRLAVEWILRHGIEELGNQGIKRLGIPAVGKTITLDRKPSAGRSDLAKVVKIGEAHPIDYRLKQLQHEAISREVLDLALPCVYGRHPAMRRQSCRADKFRHTIDEAYSIHRIETRKEVESVPQRLAVESSGAHQR